MNRIFEARCEAARVLAGIGRQKSGRRGTCAVSMSQMFLLFHKNMPSGLKEMVTKQVLQMLFAGIATSL